MYTLIKNKAIFLAVAFSLFFISGAEAATSTLTSIVVLPQVASVNAGSNQTFTAFPQDQDGVNMTDAAITWLSSNASVATINSSGTATGISQGLVTITAQSGGVSGTASLIVSPSPQSPPPFSVSLTASPATGTAPFAGSVLTVQVSGTVTGEVSYTFYFYCNRPDERTDIIPGYVYLASINGSSTYLTPFKICGSPYPDTYYAKVIAQHGGLVTQSGTHITVFPAAPTPTPAAATSTPAASTTPPVSTTPSTTSTSPNPPSNSGLANEQLRAEILRLLAMIGRLRAAIPPGFEFKKELKLGTHDQEVVYLKIILKKENCLTSKNTDYFGQGTAAGVKCFQAKYGINITGSVNQATMDKLNEIKKQTF